MTEREVAPPAKSVIITGARGYIGSALATRLRDAGYALRLVSRSADAANAAPGEAVQAGYVQADLRDEGAWSDLLSDSNTVVHLSSRTDLRAAEADPSADENINVEPVRALIRAAARSGRQPKVIFASTVTIVGNRHENPVDEKTPDRPCSVYDRHKLTCEALLREATGNGVLRACSLRLANVYGYGRVSTNANRGILNSMLRRALNKEALAVFGEGAYVRDFVHLQDVAEAFRAAVASDQLYDGSHYVIASGRGHTLAEAFDIIVEEAFHETGYRVEIRRAPEPPDLHPIERRNFVGDWRLFNELTGWRPRVELRAGIQDYFQRATSSPVFAANR
jgi:nucleoside-diphosphate-sugar epimerase